MGKRIPRLAGGVAARHRKIDPFLCQRRYGAVANAAQLPYMIAKCTDSIWWRSAQQLEGGFASLTTAPSARNYGNIYARSHPACEAGSLLALGYSTEHPVSSRRLMGKDQPTRRGV